MADRDSKDNRHLIDFWSRAYTLSEDDKTSVSEAGPDGWREMAPSQKLLDAASALGQCQKVLDYGCGSAWGAIAAAKSGCPDVTAVELSQGPLDTAAFYSKIYGTDVKLLKVEPSWLTTLPDQSFDGIICSNVLDVVPPETSAQIICQLARILKVGGSAVIGLNFYMSEEKAKERGINLVDGRKLYVDDVLRLVSFSDDEWTAMLGRHFKVRRLEHFAWPGEKSETRRLFLLTR